MTTTSDTTATIPPPALTVEEQLAELRAQLAERDAEVALLRAQMSAATRAPTPENIIAQKEAELAVLRAQVAASKATDSPSTSYSAP